MNDRRLRKLPADALICLANQYNNEIFTELVEPMILERFLAEYKSVQALILDYMFAEGLKRKKLGEVIAIKLVDTVYIVDISLIDSLIDELEIDYLWMLLIKR